MSASSSLNEDDCSTTFPGLWWGLNVITQAKPVAQGLGHNQCSGKFSYHLCAHLTSSAGLTQLTFHLADGDLSRGTKWKPGTDHRATAHVGRWLLGASGRKALGACLTSEVSKSQRTSVVCPLLLKDLTLLGLVRISIIKSHHLRVLPVPGLVLSSEQVG